MPASEAQIRANRANAQKSTGPKTPEGKAASRANAVTHGLASSVVIPQAEAAEVTRRYRSYCAELQPSGEVGLTLVLRAATLSARMERCAQHETAMLTERVRRLEAEFVPPEGVDAAEAARLRAEAGKRALFDPSKEAELARKYERAAERGFFRALKELRDHERGLTAAREEALDRELASFEPGEMTDDEFDALEARIASPTREKRPIPADLVDLSATEGRSEVPITVGRRR